MLKCFEIAAITVSHLKLSPAAKERLLAFKKLDPEIRTFKTTTQDSQEVSSGSVTMSSAGKSVKPVSQFNTADLDLVRPRRKRSTNSPSISIPKAPTKGKGVKKRKISDAEDLQGLPLIRHQFLEYFNEKFAEIEDYVGNIEELDKKIADLQQVAVLKDLALADARKELQDTKQAMAKVLVNFDYEKHDLIENAKLSAAITMYQTKLKMAQEAQDPSFDKNSWDIEGWKERLAELEDEEEEATEVLAIEASGSGKDQVKDTAAGGEEDAAKM